MIISVLVYFVKCLYKRPLDKRRVMSRKRGRCDKKKKDSDAHARIQFLHQASKLLANQCGQTEKPEQLLGLSNLYSNNVKAVARKLVIRLYVCNNV